MYPLLLWCVDLLHSGTHYMVLRATVMENKLPAQHWVRQSCRSLHALLRITHTPAQVGPERAREANAFFGDVEVMGKASHVPVG